MGKQIAVKYHYKYSEQDETIVRNYVSKFYNDEI